eukprot:CAMPEP_0173405816 /NCGR_PEP_ID=MMETSP1356-20130122/62841_1 /TAXON_ID=77927 ORGANISM="Hemiselmis virescens, Strain PCC157" /NCGR_SAMPLE_ID=MMETSP1356 /ASSEMBLY_ACC=CAM_ASM_000847 /LENGTH=89 /DNA_ID=CAMNT_0014366671 /DNA_START=188 /DNA_END=454 /DNA_ORIENTATION=-
MGNSFCCENRTATGSNSFLSTILSPEKADPQNLRYKRPIVATKFSNRSRILHVPGQYPTISAAIKAADEHDRVLIAKGVYEEALLVDKS